jgi:L-ascorbate metabolism protein UlaG (beta-lactamase superfamily)
MSASASAAGDRITYAGHATTLLELGGLRLLTDPVLRVRMLRVIHRHPPVPSPRLVERIDAVLISHLHHDHLDFRSLKRVEGHPRVIVPAGAGRTLRRRGYREAIELGVGQAARIGAAEVVATRAAHEGRRYKIGPRVEASGYVIRAGGRRVYFAGDTDLFDEMGELAGSIDVALLPIAGWGPRLGKGHMNPRTAADAAALIRPRVVIPIHWGTLVRNDMRDQAEEFLAAPAREFAAAVAELAPAVEAVVLEPGESFELG